MIRYARVTEKERKWVGYTQSNEFTAEERGRKAVADGNRGTHRLALPRP